MVNSRDFTGESCEQLSWTSSGVSCVYTSHTVIWGTSYVWKCINFILTPFCTRRHKRASVTVPVKETIQPQIQMVMCEMQHFSFFKQLALIQLAHLLHPFNWLVSFISIDSSHNITHAKDAFFSFSFFFLLHQGKSHLFTHQIERIYHSHKYISCLAHCLCAEIICWKKSSRGKERREKKKSSHAHSVLDEWPPLCSIEFVNHLIQAQFVHSFSDEANVVYSSTHLFSSSSLCVSIRRIIHFLSSLVNI